MPDLLDVFIYSEIEKGGTVAEIATVLDVPQQEIWQRVESARFSSELHGVSAWRAGVRDSENPRPEASSSATRK